MWLLSNWLTGKMSTKICNFWYYNLFVMFIKFNSRPMLQLSKSGIERAVMLQRNLVQCFVMTYSPRDVFVPFGNCRNEPVIFRAVSLINWNIRNVYTFQTSNSKNTKKRNICFIIYNYQRNYTTESSPILKWQTW